MVSFARWQSSSFAGPAVVIFNQGPLNPPGPEVPKGSPPGNPGHTICNHQYRLPLMNSSIPFSLIIARFFLCPSAWPLLRKSSFSHCTTVSHSQHPGMFFSWQHFLILQNGGPPPSRHPFLHLNLTICPSSS